jgi:hypothetical protein
MKGDAMSNDQETLRRRKLEATAFDPVAFLKGRRTAIPARPRPTQPEREGCETFTIINFRQDRLDLIAQANAIIDEYRTKGFRLTLRQLFYQFVSRDLLANDQKLYNRLGTAIRDGREGGFVPWDAIEDRTRYVRCYDTYSDVGHFIHEVKDNYREDIWSSQRFRPEVWIEKDALVGVIERVCQHWRVPYFSCRGFGSTSSAYETAQRFKQDLAIGQTPVVFHLGDHDASGNDMTRDIEARVREYAQANIEVVRLALNEDQTEGLPAQKVKDSDSRSANYIYDHGDECWELDALDPTLIENLIHEAIDERVDHDAWDAAIAHESESRNKLMEKLG